MALSEYCSVGRESADGLNARHFLGKLPAHASPAGRRLSASHLADILDSDPSSVSFDDRLLFPPPSRQCGSHRRPPRDENGSTGGRGGLTWAETLSGLGGYSRPASSLIILTVSDWTILAATWWPPVPTAALAEGNHRDPGWASAVGWPCPARTVSCPGVRPRSRATPTSMPSRRRRIVALPPSPQQMSCCWSTDSACRPPLKLFASRGPRKV